MLIIHVLTHFYPLEAVSYNTYISSSDIKIKRICLTRSYDNLISFQKRI